MIEAPFSKRIYNDFCHYCKYKKHSSESGCSLFVSKEAVCVRFEYATEQLQKQHQEETLDNWAATIWINKGKSLDTIWAMSKKELRSVLTKQHYDYFVKREKEDKMLLEQALQERENVAADEEKAFARARKSILGQKGNKLKDVEIKFIDDDVSHDAAKSLKEVTAKEPISDDLKKRLQNLLSDSKAITISTSVSPFPEMLAHSGDVDTVSTVNHYFHCQKPDGSKVTYKRSTKNKSEIATFRNYLIRHNIAILNEEEK